MSNVNVELSLEPSIGFHSKLLSGGCYSYTLTTLVGMFIANAEAIYGPRDTSYMFLGVEFNGIIPRVWYPGNRKHIAITLTDSARLNINQAIFQLAHEVVHLLSPTGGQATCIAEEGCATHFSRLCTSPMFSQPLEIDQRYSEAESIFVSMHQIREDAVRVIRGIEPCFAKWTPDILLTAVPEIPAELADQLCRPFNYLPLYG